MMTSRPALSMLLENRPRGVCNRQVDKVLRKYTSLDEMKADEYRYWQSRPAYERLDAVEEMVATAYALKGWKMEPDVRLRCPWR